MEAVAQRLSAQLANAQAGGASLTTTLDALRCGEFLELYLDQIQQVPLDQWLSYLDVTDGVVRASIVGRELATDPSLRRRSMIIDGEHLGADHLPLRGLPPGQIKAALCYANDVTVEDPFDEEQVLRDFISSVADAMPHAPIQIAPDPAHFVSTVQALARIAPVIRAGHIAFVPRRLAMDAGLSGKFASNAWETSGAQRQELALRSLRLWLASGGLVTPLFGSDDEEGAFREQAGLLAPLTESIDSFRLQRVARLALPAADRLSPEQMVRIREDDAFESFRVTQRRALAAITEESDSELADYRAEMAEAARSLGKSVANRSAFNSLFSKALGWGVGTMILAPHSAAAAIAALGGITTQVVAERVFNRDKSGKRALRHHYATLAETD
ncbi:hypothetical protein ASH01_19595 [Terrabacter sp. Soil811]|nr:hypothetical protein ASH01_19595 [Terrabacter sp. Soil811]